MVPHPTGRKDDLHMTRELWLERAIDIFRPRFEEVGHPLAERHHVSVGFGHGAKRENVKVWGQCWSSAASADKIPHIFISPELADTMEVLRVLLHELIHASLDSPAGIRDGHKGLFAEIATRLGFFSPMTETPASPTLQAELLTIADVLGDYPHGALRVRRPATVLTGVPLPAEKPAPRPNPPRTQSGPAAQKNRHIKLVCATPDCACGGYTVRTTARWIAIGLPRCPLGGELTPEE